MSHKNLVCAAALGVVCSGALASLIVVSGDQARAGPPAHRTTFCEAAVDNATALRFAIYTGGDDLRGGERDNVFADIQLVSRAGPVWIPITDRGGGLNHGRRWADWTHTTVDVPLPQGSCGFDPHTIRAIRLTTHFGGDNWNLQGISVSWVGVAASGSPSSRVLVSEVESRHDHYLDRFTADRPTYEFPVH